MRHVAPPIALAGISFVVLLGVAGGLMVHFSDTLTTNRNAVVRTLGAMDATQRVLDDLQDAETGQRGYLLTRRESYLEPFRRGAAALSDHVEAARALMADSPIQQARIATLEALAQRKFREMTESIELMRNAGADAARDAILTDVGKAVMDEIRETVGVVLAIERERLDARLRDTEESHQRLFAAGVAGAGAGFLILLLGFYLVVRSYFQLKRADAQVKQQASLLRVTIDNLADGIAAFDSSKRLIAFNRRFFALFELPDELAQPGVSLAQIKDFDRGRDGSVIAQLRAYADRQPKPDPAQPMRISFRGSMIEMYRNPMPDGGFVLSCVDISRRVAAESIAYQAQKMESIGHLTGGIAHDFNNLLQIVHSNLDMLGKDIDAASRAGQRLANARAGAERGTRLVRQLLAFARRQPLEPRPIGLGTLVNDMGDLLRRTLGERIEVETMVAGGLWNTLADPAQVETALLNLAINARDAMPDGGKLTIELSNAFLDDAYAAEHADVVPGQYVMLAVTDTGHGMAADVLERVFEPFFTTKPEGRGTGLGLSQIYGFVKQSGGHVKLYSEPGHGTTARLYLPRTRRSEERREVPVTGPVVGGGETILVVEDNESVRAGAVDALSDLGYRIVEASDGDAALGILAAGAEHIDLLFTDVVLPGHVKVRDLARLAQEHQPGIAVLYTSGYTANAIVHNGRLDEEVAFLSKPYRRDDLARKVRSVLDAARRAPCRPAVPAAATRSAGTILLVEDDVLLRMGTVDMLVELGLVVHEASTAAEALAKLAAERDIDILLTDLSLPGMNGAELIEQARRLRAGLRVIVSSGYGPTHPFRAALASMAPVVFLDKPFAMAGLQAALAAATADGPPSEATDPAGAGAGAAVR
ncbi:MAG: CHASE3 domain-containing protein [Alphaproteobacteria bacterium]|nr:CHASE3 domain-containing protein [Alphaproteobacteria bacterium]